MAPLRATRNAQICTGINQEIPQSHDPTHWAGGEVQPAIKAKLYWFRGLEDSYPFLRVHVEHN